MGELENIVLEMLNKGQTIVQIKDALEIKEDVLADIIINLDDEGFVTLQDKQWIITEKGKEIFEKKEKNLKMLKVEYLHGDINKEEYDKRKKELEALPLILYPKVEETIRIDTLEQKKIDDEFIKKIVCPKCGTENKPESNYCRKCGTALK